MTWIKLGSAFLLPPGVFLLLGGIGLALLRPAPRLGKWLLAAALALGTALSLPVVGDGLKMALESEVPGPS